MLHGSTLHDVYKVVKLIEAQNRMAVARGWEKGNRKLFFKGYKVSVCKM